MKRSDIIFWAAFLVTFLSFFLCVFEISYFFIFADGVYFPLSVAAFFVTYYLWFWKSSSRGEVNMLDLLVGGYVGYGIINSFFLNQTGFISSVSSLSAPFFSYFTLRLYFSSQDRLTNQGSSAFIISILTVGFIPMIIGILEFSSVIPVPVRFKMTGGFYNPGVFANFIATIFAFSLSILSLAKDHDIRMKLFSWLVCVTAVVVLALSNARSAWIGAGVSAVYVFSHNPWIADVTGRLLIRVNRGLLFVLLALTVIMSAYLLYQFKKESADGRLFIWKICLQMPAEKPVFGHGSGLNGFPKAFNEAQRSYFARNPNDITNGLLADDGKYAFNEYLQIVIESGIIGLGLFTWVVFLGLRVGCGDRSDKFAEPVLRIACKAGAIATLTCGLFSYPLRNTIHQSLFFIFIAYLSSGLRSYSNPFFSNGIIRKTILTLLVAWAASILVYQFRVMNYSYKWKEAYIQYRNGNVDSSLKRYDAIQPFFRDYFLFMFNFGGVFYVNGQYDKAMRAFEHASELNASYDVLLNLGGCYESVGWLEKAEGCYIRAADSIPHKLTARYRLFRLYLRTNQTEKAKHAAVRVQNMPVKVETMIVGQMKKEIIDYLSGKESTLPTSK